MSTLHSPPRVDLGRQSCGHSLPPGGTEPLPASLRDVVRALARAAAREAWTSHLAGRGAADLPEASYAAC
jgi:hypothetical protein